MHLISRSRYIDVKKLFLQIHFDKSLYYSFELSIFFFNLNVTGRLLTNLLNISSNYNYLGNIVSFFTLFK